MPPRCDPPRLNSAMRSLLCRCMVERASKANSCQFCSAVFSQARDVRERFMVRWAISGAAAVMLAGSAWAQTAAAPASSAAGASPMASMAAPPQAKIETSLGSFTVTLDPTNAPKSTANFIAYTKAGHYDGTMIYRVVPGFVIQMGSFEPNGRSRPVHAPIPLESANGLKNVRGAVAMARQNDPQSGTAEFFVDLADSPDLDPKPGASPNSTGYAVFG